MEASNGRVTEAVSHQVAIDRELQRVASEAGRFREENRRWMRAFDELKTALKVGLWVGG